MEGSEGDWEVFLSKHDKLFGSRIRDPRMKSAVTLARFLKTFSREDDLKFFDYKMHWYSKQDMLRKFIEESREVESPVQGWLRMKLSTNQIKKFPKMLAVDCEMVLCEDGTEALVRVCAVGRNLQLQTIGVKLLGSVQKIWMELLVHWLMYRQYVESMKKLFFGWIMKKKLLRDGKTILIGRSLNNDLKALKLDHGRVIDTSLIFKHGDGANFKRPSLNDLCKASC
ncbi:Small RNA degrading nuclease 3 [Camellia lanceoleosa]|uniref:Small RNA degrading nuclease 3 n=1 Tax=Camellia lanceoleosa TaxID=1840588 RepID=A0ACC0FQL8_9ERIC|nr:Small RNA degrading nuclease 3 [Camellia lanceoleosa]